MATLKHISSYKISGDGITKEFDIPVGISCTSSCIKSVKINNTTIPTTGYSLTSSDSVNKIVFEIAPNNGAEIILYRPMHYEHTIIANGTDKEFILPDDISIITGCTKLYATSVFVGDSEITDYVYTKTDSVNKITFTTAPEDEAVIKIYGPNGFTHTTTGNGTDTEFTLPDNSSLIKDTDTIVYKNGAATSDYTYTRTDAVNKIIFTDAPDSGTENIKISFYDCSISCDKAVKCTLDCYVKVFNANDECVCSFENVNAIDMDNFEYDGIWEIEYGGFSGGYNANIIGAGGAIGNGAVSNNGGSVGADAKTTEGGSVGYKALSKYGGAIGREAMTVEKYKSEVFETDSIEYTDTVKIQISSFNPLTHDDWDLRSADLTQSYKSIIFQSTMSYGLDSVDNKYYFSFKTAGIEFDDENSRYLYLVVATNGGAVGEHSVSEYGGAVGYYTKSTSGGAVGFFTSAGTGGAVGDSAEASSGGAIGENATTTTGGAVGYHAEASSGGAVGENAKTTSGGVIGYYAKALSGGGAVGDGAEALNGFAGGDMATTRAGGAIGAFAKSTIGGGSAGYGSSTSTGGAVGSNAISGKVIKMTVTKTPGTDPISVTFEDKNFTENKDYVDIYDVTISGLGGSISNYIDSVSKDENNIVTITIDKEAFKYPTNDIYIIDVSQLSSGGAVGEGAITITGGAVGENATTTTGGAVGYHAEASSGGAVGESATTTTGGAVGNDTHTGSGGAVGNYTNSLNGFSGGCNARTENGVAIGKNALTVAGNGFAYKGVSVDEQTNNYIMGFGVTPAFIDEYLTNSQYQDIGIFEGEDKNPINNKYILGYEILSDETIPPTIGIILSKDASIDTTYSPDKYRLYTIGSGVAIGHTAITTGNDSVQLGSGKNSNDGTLQFRSTQIIDSNGHIPYNLLVSSINALDPGDKANLKTALGIS